MAMASAPKAVRPLTPRHEIDNRNLLVGSTPWMMIVVTVSLEIAEVYTCLCLLKHSDSICAVGPA